jgi:2,3-dihydroxybenzoate decarboxylase
MEYIALEECCGIPELAARRSDALSGIRSRRSYMSEVHSRLNDFTEYRLPEMDNRGASPVVGYAGHPVPGSLSPQEAIDDARLIHRQLNRDARPPIGPALTTRDTEESV